MKRARDKDVGGGVDNVRKSSEIHPQNKISLWWVVNVLVHFNLYFVTKVNFWQSLKVESKILSCKCSLPAWFITTEAFKPTQGLYCVINNSEECHRKYKFLLQAGFLET